MYVYKWIEGEKNLIEYCEKRFHERPRFLETIGKVGPATIWYKEKYKEGYGYVQMYFLYMPINDPDKGHYFQELQNLAKMDYESIRLDRTALLKR